MDFPLVDLLDEAACYDYLVEALHPDGLRCPRCAHVHATVHRAHREPVLDYRCCACGRVFNAWTGTAFQGTQRSPAQLLLIVRGIAQGTPTAQLARELDCSRQHLLQLRRHLQHLAWVRLPRPALPDAEVEADELYQNAGKKGQPHTNPDDPPRRRANQRRGHGTFATDRPPVLGVVGRESGQVQLCVLETADADSLVGFVVRMTRRGTLVYTDEWSGYHPLPRHGREHATVCHSAEPPEWARDDDGDGIREVHNNTLEGLWTGLRNFLRLFRGVTKWFLEEYVGIFQWAYNCKTITAEFIRALVGLEPMTTNLGP